MNINLSERQVQVTNLNFQPEKAGDELVERVDLSLELLLEEEDLAKLIDTTLLQPAAVLWDEKGHPALTNVDKITLSVKAAGTAQLRMVHTEGWLTFNSATLKKCTLEPMLETRALLKCQVRVDPTGCLEDLGAMRIDEQAIFEFKGSPVDEQKNENQGEMPV